MLLLLFAIVGVLLGRFAVWPDCGCLGAVLFCQRSSESGSCRVSESRLRFCSIATALRTLRKAWPRPQWRLMTRTLSRVLPEFDVCLGDADVVVTEVLDILDADAAASTSVAIVAVASVPHSGIEGAVWWGSRIGGSLLPRRCRLNHAPRGRQQQRECELRGRFVRPSASRAAGLE